MDIQKRIEAQLGALLVQLQVKDVQIEILQHQNEELKKKIESQGADINRGDG